MISGGVEEFESSLDSKKLSFTAAEMPILSGSSAYMISASVEVEEGESPTRADHMNVAAAEMPWLSDSSASMISGSVEACDSPAHTKDYEDLTTDMEGHGSLGNHETQNNTDIPADQRIHAVEQAKADAEMSSIGTDDPHAQQAAEVKTLSTNADCENDYAVVHPASSSTIEAEDAPSQVSTADAVDGQVADSANGHDSLGDDLIAAVMGSPIGGRPVIGLAAICGQAEVGISGNSIRDTAGPPDSHVDDKLQNVLRVEEEDSDDDLMSPESAFSSSGKWIVLDDSSDWDDSEGEMPGVGLTRQALDQRLEVARAQSRLGQADSGSQCESPSGSDSSSPLASPDGNGPSLTPGTEIDWSALYNLNTEEDDDDAGLLGYIVNGRPFLGLETIYEEYEFGCEEENDKLSETQEENETQEDVEVPMKLPLRQPDEELEELEELEEDLEAADDQSCPAEFNVDEEERTSPDPDPQEEESEGETETAEKHFMRDSLKAVEIPSLLPCGRGTPSRYERYSLASLHDDKEEQQQGIDSDDDEWIPGSQFGEILTTNMLEPSDQE
eukprot:gnl/MRDRNA2_/MRDRNA2_28673_c0_seq1.p1 gnl/MRDRNA2_/MRDRNA2_28673_c0~~gnl/MRDRNA2_/MRDRNA2_28673_c0_seq1.p1  ORF type:complete len:557 (-),score=149.83 gnl/MRDRNA2_/MRDRNA2_28673_c0_seq1:1-1671(-)